jgi:hypothetical protein
VDLARFFSFLIYIYTVSRTPWTVDQPAARPLPTYRTKQTQNKRRQTSMPRMGFKHTIPVFEWAKTTRPLWTAFKHVCKVFFTTLATLSDDGQQWPEHVTATVYVLTLNLLHLMNLTIYSGLYNLVACGQHTQYLGLFYGSYESILHFLKLRVKFLLHFKMRLRIFYIFSLKIIY